MSAADPAPFPARPSLTQLRKQAKDLLRASRAGDAAASARIHLWKPEVATPTLADAQFVLAREYGFDSWPKLVHHVEVSRSAEIAHFESIASDFVAAYAGDHAALVRLNERFADRKDHEH